MVMDSRVDVSVTVVVSMSALCSCIDVSVTIVVSMSALLGERWELRGYGKLYRC